MAGAISQDLESCQFPFLLDERPMLFRSAPRRSVVERMHFWDVGPDDETVVERDYESLVGVAGVGRGKPGKSRAQAARF